MVDLITAILDPLSNDPENFALTVLVIVIFFMYRIQTDQRKRNNELGAQAETNRARWERTRERQMREREMRINNEAKSMAVITQLRAKASTLQTSELESRKQAFNLQQQINENTKKLNAFKVETSARLGKLNDELEQERKKYDEIKEQYNNALIELRELKKVNAENMQRLAIAEQVQATNNRLTKQVEELVQELAVKTELLKQAQERIETLEQERDTLIREQNKTDKDNTL